MCRNTLCTIERDQEEFIFSLPIFEALKNAKAVLINTNAIRIQVWIDTNTHAACLRFWSTLNAFPYRPWPKRPPKKSPLYTSPCIFVVLSAPVELRGRLIVSYDCAHAHMACDLPAM